MAESGREKGSVIVSFRGGEDTTQKKKKNPYKIIIGEVIAFVVILFLFYLIKKYANVNNCGSEFWIYLSNGGTEIQSACFGVFTSIFPFINGVKNFMSKGWHSFTNLIVPIGIFVVGTLSFLCLLTFFNIKGTVEKENEIQNQLAQNNDTQMGSNSGQESKEAKEIIYYIDQDLYMGNRPLEDYYSGIITDENSESVKAEILYNNLENNKPKGGTSDNYSELLETADYYYESYKFKKEYADMMENTSEEWFEDRIESLQKSLDLREEAEKEYVSPKNERPIAAGYRDKGDEYYGMGNQNTSIDAYEKSTCWFMKAIYHAAAIGDYEEMNTSMELFRKLGEEVQKLNKIELNRRNQISEWIEVYGIFVELVNKGR